MTKFASKALTLKEKSTRKKKCNHESRISGAKFFNFRTLVSFLQLVVLCGQRTCRLLYQFKFESHWNVHFSVKCCLKGTNRDRDWPSSPYSSNLFSLCAPFLYFSQYNLIFPSDQFLQFCQLCFSIILSVLSSHCESGFVISWTRHKIYYMPVFQSPSILLCFISYNVYCRICICVNTFRS